MISWLATGPPVTCCVAAPTSVWTSVPEERFWIIPAAMKMTAPTSEIGSR